MSAIPETPKSNLRKRLIHVLRSAIHRYNGVLPEPRPTEVVRSCEEYNDPKGRAMEPLTQRATRNDSSALSSQPWSNVYEAHDDGTSRQCVPPPVNRAIDRREQGRNNETAETPRTAATRSEAQKLFKLTRLIKALPDFQRSSQNNNANSTNAQCDRRISRQSCYEASYPNTNLQRCYWDPDTTDGDQQGDENLAKEGTACKTLEYNTEYMRFLDDDDIEARRQGKYHKTIKGTQEKLYRVEERAGDRHPVNKYLPTVRYASRNPNTRVEKRSISSNTSEPLLSSDYSGRYVVPVKREHVQGFGETTYTPEHKKSIETLIHKYDRPRHTNKMGSGDDEIDTADCGGIKTDAVAVTTESCDDDNDGDQESASAIGNAIVNLIKGSSNNTKLSGGERSKRSKRQTVDAGVEQLTQEPGPVWAMAGGASEKVGKSQQESQQTNFNDMFRTSNQKRIQVSGIPKPGFVAAEVDVDDEDEAEDEAEDAEDVEDAAKKQKNRVMFQKRIEKDLVPPFTIMSNILHAGATYDRQWFMDATATTKDVSSFTYKEALEFLIEMDMHHFDLSNTYRNKTRNKTRNKSKNATTTLKQQVHAEWEKNFKELKETILQSEDAFELEKDFTMFGHFSTKKVTPEFIKYAKQKNCTTLKSIYECINDYLLQELSIKEEKEQIAEMKPEMTEREQQEGEQMTPEQKEIISMVIPCIPENTFLHKFRLLSDLVNNYIQNKTKYTTTYTVFRAAVEKFVIDKEKSVIDSICNETGDTEMGRKLIRLLLKENISSSIKLPVAPVAPVSFSRAVCTELKRNRRLTGGNGSTRANCIQQAVTRAFTSQTNVDVWKEWLKDVFFSDATSKSVQKILLSTTNDTTNNNKVKRVFNRMKDSRYYNSNQFFHTYALAVQYFLINDTYESMNDWNTNTIRKSVLLSDLLKVLEGEKEEEKEENNNIQVKTWYEASKHKKVVDALNQSDVPIKVLFYFLNKIKTSTDFSNYESELFKNKEDLNDKKATALAYLKTCMRQFILLLKLNIGVTPYDLIRIFTQIVPCNAAQDDQLLLPLKALGPLGQKFFLSVRGACEFANVENIDIHWTKWVDSFRRCYPQLFENQQLLHVLTLLFREYQTEHDSVQLKEVVDSLQHTFDTRLNFVVRKTSAAGNTSNKNNGLTAEQRRRKQTKALLFRVLREFESIKTRMTGLSGY